MVRDARVRIVDNPELTTPSGLNYALDRATGEVVIRMDVHTSYAPDYIRVCVETLERTGADNVGGPARTRAHGYVQNANSLAYHSFFSVGGARFHDVDYEGEVDTVVYGCWRREVFDRIGRFDTALVRNQDDEFNLRLKRAGGRIWQNPNIRSWYFPRARLRDLFKQYRQYGYWKVSVIRKHRRPGAWRHLVPGALLIAAGLSIMVALFWPPAIWVLVAAVGFYLLTSVTVSMVVCRHHSHWRYLPIMPLVFASYHLGYGIGFLEGLAALLARRKSTQAGFQDLTR